MSMECKKASIIDSWANMIVTRRLHGYQTCAQRKKTHKCECIDKEFLREARPATLDNEKVWNRRIELKAEIAKEHEAYLAENYESKRMDLHKQILELIRDMWFEVRSSKTIDLKLLDVLCLTLTFGEFWGLMERWLYIEHQNLGIYMTRSLIDEFARQFKLLKVCEQRREADFADFAELLKLRDEMVKCMQHSYRITFSLAIGANLDEPKDMTNALFLPYDMDWISGARNASYLEENKLLSTARMNECSLFRERVRIIQAADLPRLPKRTAYLPPFPMSKGTKPDITTIESIKRSECKTTLTLYWETNPNHSQLKVLSKQVCYLECRGEMRRRKKNIIKCLMNDEMSEEKRLALQNMVGYMAAAEAQMLILERVFASYADQKLGIFGPRMPGQIYKDIGEIYLYANVNYPAHSQLETRLTESLTRIRENIIPSAKYFFLHNEKDLEKRFQCPIDVENQKFFKNSVDLPIEMKPWSDEFRKNFTIVGVELKRLRSELNAARQINGVQRNLNYTISKYPNEPIVYVSNIRKLNLEARVAKLPLNVQKNWKAMSTCFDKVDSCVSKFIKQHVHDYVYRHCPDLRKTLKDAVVISFSAAVLHSFEINEVVDGHIVDRHRAQCRLQTLMNIFEKIFVELNSEKQKKLDLEYHSYMTTRYSEYFRDSDSPNDGKSMVPNSTVSYGDVVSTLTHFVSFLLTHRDILSVRS